MNQIMPYPLWIGHGGEGHDFVSILDAGIEAVIELAGEEPSFPSRRDLISCRFPLLDGVGNRPELIGLAIRTVTELLRAGIPTLVCCSGGESRSPAIAAVALAIVHGLPPGECLKQIATHHRSDVSPGLWDEVVRLSTHAFERGEIIHERNAGTVGPSSA